MFLPFSSFSISLNRMSQILEAIKLAYIQLMGRAAQFGFISALTFQSEIQPSLMILAEGSVTSNYAEIKAPAWLNLHLVLDKQPQQYSIHQNIVAASVSSDQLDQKFFQDLAASLRSKRKPKTYRHNMGKALVSQQELQPLQEMTIRYIERLCPSPVKSLSRTIKAEQYVKKVEAKKMLKAMHAVPAFHMPTKIHSIESRKRIQRMSSKKRERHPSLYLNSSVGEKDLAAMRARMFRIYSCQSQFKLRSLSSLKQRSGVSKIGLSPTRIQ